MVTSARMGIFVSRYSLGRSIHCERMSSQQRMRHLAESQCTSCRHLHLRLVYKHSGTIYRFARPPEWCNTEAIPPCQELVSVVLSGTIFPPGFHKTTTTPFCIDFGVMRYVTHRAKL